MILTSKGCNLISNLQELERKKRNILGSTYPFLFQQQGGLTPTVWREMIYNKEAVPC